MLPCTVLVTFHKKDLRTLFILRRKIITTVNNIITLDDFLLNNKMTTNIVSNAFDKSKRSIEGTCNFYLRYSRVLVMFYKVQ